MIAPLNSRLCPDADYNTMTDGPENDDFEEVPPDASGMIEGLRAGGYSLATALADIIDNSITAGSRHVWLRMEWQGDDSWISITDDGRGMAEQELKQAMRLASTNPLEERGADDLGRFGLGLKTASFSQARRLTVFSKAAGSAAALRRWDLDHLARPDVTGWQLLRTAHSDTGDRLDELKRLGLESGTVVLLEELDRVVRRAGGHDTDNSSEKHWVNQVERVRQHLGMVFHRFLERQGANRLTISINGSKVEPWDPFCEAHPATQREAEDGNERLGSKVHFKGYILPHRDRFDPKKPENGRKLHRAAAGPNGWNAHQGFYLYRNDRLIIPGDWLGLGPGQNGWKKEEHFKLARIRVDIPNSMDTEWQIDVKKSAAAAPPPLRSWLTSLAKTVRDKAKRVYAHRGAHGHTNPGNNTVAPAPEQPNPWETRTRNDGTFSYRVSRRHPLYKALLSVLKGESRDRMETFLRLVEETVPVQRIWIDAAEHEEAYAKPFDGEQDRKLRCHIETCHSALCSVGNDEESAWQVICGFPAFQTEKAAAIIGQLRESAE